MSRTRRKTFGRALVCAALSFAAILCGPVLRAGETPSGAASAQPSVAERALFEAANRERTLQGLPALRWDAALASAARAHAALMAQRGTLSHQFPGEPPVQDRARHAGARFSVIAENVAEAPTPEMIHSSWMHSPPHRANILDHELNALGVAVVGVTDRRNGQTELFAVQDFSQGVADLSYEQQEQQVGELVAARGVQLKATNGDARKTCEMDRGWAGDRPGAVVRFESADLEQLPDDLDHKVLSGKYREASVGACAPGESQGFARFRLAVLLY